jgi:hypothetical protein
MLNCIASPQQPIKDTLCPAFPNLSASDDDTPLEMGIREDDTFALLQIPRMVAIGIGVMSKEFACAGIETRLALQAHRDLCADGE